MDNVNWTRRSRGLKSKALFGSYKYQKSTANQGLISPARISVRSDGLQYSSVVILVVHSGVFYTQGIYPNGESFVIPLSAFLITVHEAEKLWNRTVLSNQFGITLINQL